MPEHDYVLVEVPGVGEVEFPASMSDEEIAAAIKNNILKQPAQKAKKPEERGFVDEAVGYAKDFAQEVPRQLGLTGRYAVEGLTAIPAMIAQPFASGADYLLEKGGSDFRFGNQMGNVSGLLSEAGLPQPETDLENLVAVPSRGLASGGSVLGTAQRMTGPLANTLAQAPGYQAAGEIGAGLASEKARQEGAHPGLQFLAGLGGGIASPLALKGSMDLGRGITRGAKAAAQPFRQSGRERIVGNLLRDQADNADDAIRNLQNYDDVVPGSQQTAGAASRDTGLVALEKGMRSTNSRRFAQRNSEQNLARQQQLDDIAGTPAQLADDVAAREAGTASAREAAFANNPQVNTQRIIDKADEILASPAGARKPVQQAIRQFRRAIDGETDAARLYEIRKDIGDAMAGKYSGDKGSYKLAKRELIGLRESIDEAIEDVAPGFRAYLDRYKELSRPINQKEILQELQERSVLAAPDVSTGRDFLSQARYTRNLDKILSDPMTARDLTEEQVRAARAVAADLDLSAAHTSAGLRAPGSDTVQNLSLANVFQSARGGKDVPAAFRIVAKPMEWVYKLTDSQIDELLTDAMLDPKLAARLMGRATRKNAESLSRQLKSRARALGLGTGVATAEQQSRERQRREQQAQR